MLGRSSSQVGGSTLTTYYFAGGAYEVRDDGSTQKVLKYYAFAGMAVAINDGSGLEFFLTDQLGSVVAVTDASGALLSQQRYLPFGQVRTDAGSITQSDLGFTGQRNLDVQDNSFSLGLMDYNARFYDPSLGRFTQPDVITAGGPQGLNRYSYVNNNPTNFIDPSGHCIEDLCIGEVIIGIALLELAVDAFTTSNFYANNPAPNLDFHIHALDDVQEQVKTATMTLSIVGAYVDESINSQMKGKRGNGVPFPNPQYEKLQESNNYLIKATSPGNPGLPPLQNVCKGWGRALPCAVAIGYGAYSFYESVTNGGSDDSHIPSELPSGPHGRNKTSTGSSSIIPSYNNSPSTEPIYNNYPYSSQRRQRELDY